MDLFNRNPPAEARFSWSIVGSFLQTPKRHRHLSSHVAIMDPLRGEYSNHLPPGDRMRRSTAKQCAAGFVRAVVILFLLVSLPSCSRPVKVPVIALITPLTTMDLWKGMHAGVYKACLEAHCQRYWNAPTHEDDFERQIDLVQQELKRRVDGIILAPAQASALVPITARAQRDGIPIVITSNDLAMPLTPPVATITSDDTETGRLGAEAVAGLIHGRGAVAIVGIDPSSSATLARAASFEAEIHRRYPSIRIAARTFTRNNMTRTYDAEADDLGTVHAKPNAIFTVSVSGTQNVLSSLQSLNSASRPAIIACDQESDLLDELRSGHLNGLIAQNTYEIGYLAVHEIMGAVLHGATPRSHTVKPMLLTRTNVDSAPAQEFLKPYKGFDR